MNNNEIEKVFIDPNMSLSSIAWSAHHEDVQPKVIEYQHPDSSVNSVLQWLRIPVWVMQSESAHANVDLIMSFTEFKELEVQIRRIAARNGWV